MARCWFTVMTACPGQRLWWSPTSCRHLDSTSRQLSIMFSSGGSVSSPMMVLNNNWKSLNQSTELSQRTRWQRIVPYPKDRGRSNYRLHYFGLKYFTSQEMRKVMMILREVVKLESSSEFRTFLEERTWKLKRVIICIIIHCYIHSERVMVTNQQINIYR